MVHHQEAHISIQRHEREVSRAVIVHYSRHFVREGAETKNICYWFIFNWPQLRRAPIKFGWFIELKSYNINFINIFYKQADRSFTVPILEGTNRYKGVVHKIHARVPLRSAHVKKYSHCEYIAHLLSYEFNSTKKLYTSRLSTNLRSYILRTRPCQATAPMQSRLGPQSHQTIR
jgi:hypothetical protein